MIATGSDQQSVYTINDNGYIFMAYLSETIYSDDVKLIKWQQLEGLGRSISESDNQVWVLTKEDDGTNQGNGKVYLYVQTKSPWK